MIYQDENEGADTSLPAPVRAKKSGNVLSVSSRKIVNSNLNQNEVLSISKNERALKKKEKIHFPAVPDQFTHKAKQFQRKVRENPQQSSAWWMLIHFYSAKCKLDHSQMLDVCEKACFHATNDNSDHIYTKLHLAQCKYLCQCHRPKEALRLYKAMDMNGIGRELYYFWVGYAATLVRDNKKQAAIQLLHKALARNLNFSPADENKLKIYIRDLEAAKSPNCGATPKERRSPIESTPQSKEYIASTPHNSFDSQISTPACLIQGMRPSPPVMDTPSVPCEDDTLSKEPRERSKELSIASNSQAAKEPETIVDTSSSSVLSTAPSVTTIEEDVVFHDDEYVEEKLKAKEESRLKEFSVNGKKYWKLGVMGCGGTSCVFKALGTSGSGSKKSFGVFAIKQVKFEGQNPTNTAVLKNEIEYLLSLQGQRNIVKLYDHEINKKCLFLVLELGDVDLRVLMRKLSTQKLRMNAIRVYWQEMLAAVSVIHSKRIVHTDLKPANFVSFSGQLKLIDFGIAGAIQANTVNIKRDSVAGTFNYISPEALNYQESINQIKLGVPSDVWSLGIILYEMVYNTTPFASIKGMPRKISCILSEEYEINYPEVSNEHVVDVIKSCLQRDPSKRATTEELLRHPFLR